MYEIAPEELLEKLVDLCFKNQDWCLHIKHILFTSLIKHYSPKPGLWSKQKVICGGKEINTEKKERKGGREEERVEGEGEKERCIGKKKKEEREGRRKEGKKEGRTKKLVVSCHFNFGKNYYIHSFKGHSYVWPQNAQSEWFPPGGVYFC